MDFKLELVLLPVTDVERSKHFYQENMGFDLDVDHQPNDEFRVLQFTPPGSACSVTFGKGIVDTTPGSVRGLHLVVTDIEAARAVLVGRGVEVGGIRHMGPNGWEPGRDPPTPGTTLSPRSPTLTATPGSSRRCPRGLTASRPDLPAV